MTHLKTPSPRIYSFMDNNIKNKKIIDLLTICRKAAKASLGFEAAKQSLAEGKAALILTARDISPKTEKEIRFFADKKKVPVMKTDLTIEETGIGIGRKAGVIAICDEGFSKKLSDLISE